MAATSGMARAIALTPDQDSAGYHTRNRDGELQRANIIDDLLAGLLLQVELQGVVHGTLSPGGDAATLLVLQFYFQGKTDNRRFRNAEVKVRFADQQQPLEEDPEVLALWPEGDFTFEESGVEVNDSKAVGASLGGGAAGLQMGINGNLTRNTNTKRSERASVNGARRIEGRDWGAKNVVRLVLDENRDQKKGIVSGLSAAILLKRSRPGCRFIAIIDVKAQADLKYATAWRIRDLSGKTPVNDPVVFDVSCKPTITVKDTSNLAAEDLSSLAHIVSTTVISTIKNAA